jgi:hypothetical protein
MTQKIANRNWDKTFSTYWWKIDLNPSYEINKLPYMIGYSKVDGENEGEAFDKHRLMKTKIHMLFQKGYIKRCTQIHIFKRKSSYIQSREDEEVVTLYPNDFKVLLEYPFDRHDLVIWLKQIYNDVMQGKEVKHLLPKKINYTVNLDDKLKLSNYNINKSSDLQVICAKLKADGFTDGSVLSFYHKGMNFLERKGVTA